MVSASTQTSIVLNDEDMKAKRRLPTIHSNGSLLEESEEGLNTSKYINKSDTDSL
jgi:hypothetical protein